MPRLPAGRFVVGGRDLAMPLVEQCGYLARKDTQPLPRHRHDGFEFTYALRGANVWDLGDGESVPLAGGHLAVLPPGVDHHGEDAVIRPMDLLWLVIRPQARGASRHAPFTATELRQLAARLRSAAPASVAMSDRLWEAAQELARAVHAAQTVGNHLALARVRAGMATVLVESVRVIERREDGGAGPAVLGAQRAMARAVAAGDTPSVAAIAAAVGLRASRFHALFRAATGFAPAAYLMHLRCARARRLLASGDTSVTAIAHGCGFASSQHLARCFRREYGMTPSGYRRRCRQTDEPQAFH